jgi:hypothetical protein
MTEVYSAGHDHECVVKTITQASHGFSVGNWAYHNGTIYAKAKADAAATSEALGMVTAVDGDDFTITLKGWAAVTGATVGQNYLSADTAGAMTPTEPSTTNHVSKPVMFCVSTTGGYVSPQRGMVIAGSSAASVWTDSGTYLKPVTDGDNVRVYDGSNYSELTENVLALQERSDAPSMVTGHFQVYGKTVGPAWNSYTKLMLHCNGTDASMIFTDEIGKTVTPSGDAQIDTAQSKFGGASALFDGTGDYLTIADSADWDFGTADFTIDFWVRPSDAGGSYRPLIGRESTWELCLHNNVPYFFTSGYGSDVAFGGTALSSGTWYHIALVNYSGTLKCYVDGTARATSGAFNGGDLSSALSVCYDVSYGRFAGHIDELRVSKGIARWTTDFTAPSSAYVADTYTYTYHVKLPDGTEKTVTLT